MLINSALLLTLPRISAQECQPLCWLDTQRTGRCQVSPVYMASLLDRLSQGSIWGEVATQNLACRSLNSSACSSPECNLHDDGSCMIRANWVGRKLGNASVGTKCGLLGQIMADEATCYQLEQSACSFTLTSCSWDQVRGVCGISPSHVLVLLRQDGSSAVGTHPPVGYDCPILRSIFGDEWLHHQPTDFGNLSYSQSRTFWKASMWMESSQFIQLIFLQEGRAFSSIGFSCHVWFPSFGIA